MFYNGATIHLADVEIPLQTVLTSSSQQAEAINRVTNYFFIAAAAMLLLVIILTAFIVYNFRHRSTGQTAEKTLSQKWEYAMIGVPLALVGVFLYFTITTMHTVQGAEVNRNPDITITGNQWWWQAVYPDTTIKTANEIHVPAGKKLLIKLNSSDVIHDWWIPQFGNKMDMVPGQDNYLWVTINKPGTYYGICSEFCGDQHAHMRIKVIAQTAAGYNAWLSACAQPAVNNPEFETGKKLFNSTTCGDCHRINGTEANGSAGPDLTHLANRETLLAGMLDNNVENLENWIRNPQQVKPGAHMPDFILPDSSVVALAKYLHSLK